MWCKHSAARLAVAFGPKLVVLAEISGVTYGGDLLRLVVEPDKLNSEGEAAAQRFWFAVLFYPPATYLCVLQNA